MNEFSSGNKIVDEVGKIRITGNIVPISWFKTIRYANGKPNNNAINILSDIVYWYRPKEKRAEETGQLLRMEKKFKADLLQRSYDEISRQFGITKTQAVNAIKELEKLGVIRRQFRNVSISGRNVNNLLFLELVPEKLKQLTYPIGWDDAPIPIFKERAPDIQEGSLLHENEDTPYIEIETNTETNTKNTTQITGEKSDHINPDKDGEIDEIWKSEKQIKDNISYDDLMIVRPDEKTEIDEIVNLLLQTIGCQGDAIRIGGAEYPHSFVEKRLLSLRYDHICYVLDCMKANTTKVHNIRAYMLAALFNAPATMDNYYRAEVNHNMKGGA